MPSTLAAAALRVGTASVPSPNARPRSYGVATGQTFVEGDFVLLNSSGLIEIAATAGNDVGNVRLLGRALAPAARCLADGVTCPVLSLKDCEFYLPLYHSTASSATLAENEVDTPLTLPLRNQGGIWCLNKENNGTNDRFIITGRWYGYPFGEQFGVVRCEAMDAALFEKAS